MICPGSGTAPRGATSYGADYKRGGRMVVKRGACRACGKDLSVTRKGVMRAHQKPVAA